MPTNAENIKIFIAAIKNATSVAELDSIMNNIANQKILALLRINKRHEYNGLMRSFVRRRNELLPENQKIISMTFDDRAKYLTQLTPEQSEQRKFAEAAQLAVTSAKKMPSIDKLINAEDLQEKLKASEAQALSENLDQAIRAELEHRLVLAIVKKGMLETDKCTSAKELLLHINQLKLAAKRVNISESPKLAAALDILILHAELNLVAISKPGYEEKDRAANLAHIASALSREFRHAENDFGATTLQQMSLDADVFVKTFLKHLNANNGFKTEFDKLNLIAYIIGPDFSKLELKPLPPTILAAFTREYTSIASNKALPQIMKRQNELAKIIKANPKNEENYDKLYAQAEILLKLGDYIEDKAQLKTFYTNVLTPVYKNISEALFSNLSFKDFMIESEKLFSEIDEYLKQISEEQKNDKRVGNSVLLADVYIQTLKQILILSETKKETSIPLNHGDDIPTLTVIPDMIKALEAVKSRDLKAQRKGPTSNKRILKF